MKKTLLATQDTFTKTGRFVRRGQQVNPDEVDFDKETSTNLAEVSGELDTPIVEVSAIAPTGPNPVQPQQIGPGTVQLDDGYVNANGARLVGEVTMPADKRIVEIDDGAEAELTEKLEAAENADKNVSNEGTEGTVADVVARMETMDAAQLDQLERAEKDREKPRTGVLSAIEARRGQLLAS